MIFKVSFFEVIEIQFTGIGQSKNTEERLKN